MIAIWDDHEFADNAARQRAGNHQPTCVHSGHSNATDAEKQAAQCEADEGDYAARVDAAAQAWSEWMYATL